MLDLEEFKKQNLVCLECNSALLYNGGINCSCSNDICSRRHDPYTCIDGKPVLVDFNNSILKKEIFYLEKGRSKVRRTKEGIIRSTRDKHRKKNNITITNIDFLTNEILKIKNPKILIIGGGEIGSGMESLYLNHKEKICSFDIYNSPNVDFIADAHQIPIRNESFDVVIIQAVLEHVLNPQKVVSEIWRLLKLNGIVYAETPFIQHVHEGPYDFTRFTESGHRYLFKNFELVKSGFNLGAATSLLWSLDYFVSGLFRTKMAGKILRFLFFWLPYFDLFIPDRFNIDGACGIYFLGRKSNVELKEASIIDHYKGNQR